MQKMTALSRIPSVDERRTDHCPDRYGEGLRTCRKIGEAIARACIQRLFEAAHASARDAWQRASCSDWQWPLPLPSRGPFLLEGCAFALPVRGGDHVDLSRMTRRLPVGRASGSFPDVDLRRSPDGHDSGSEPN
jgi:hypothetical protein